MIRVAVVASLLWALPGLASAAVDVRHQGTKVSVHVQAAPLPEVLDRLSKELGMKVVYEGPRPQGLVNASVDDRTPAEAVLTVLEGLGLNFMARMDATGTRVEQLVIAGTASAAPATSVAAAAPSRATSGVAEDDEEDEDEEPAEDAKPERPRPGMLAPRGRPAVTNAPDTPPGASVPAASPSLPTISLPSYPTSPFAPAGPAPPTVVLPPPSQPVEESDDDPTLQ
jgi:ribosomal protein L12E/L44/L45/RPP1/RPP2